MRFKGINGIRGLAGLLFVLCLLALYGIFFSSRSVWHYQHQNRQVQELEARNQLIDQNNQELFQRIQAVNAEPVAEERLIRERLGWVRTDEVVIEFLPAASQKPLDAP